MTAKIGSMIIDFQARTQSLETGLKKTRKELRELKKGKRDTSKATDGLSAAFKRLAGPLAIGAVATGLTTMVRRQTAYIDQAKKFADRIGLTTESLVALRHAAELSGVASNTLDQALQRMTRRVAEAGQGSGEAVQALKELGINAQSLARLSPDAQFERVAEAMSRVGDRATQVRLAFKLFDSEGVAVLNTLDQIGKSGLQGAVAETKRLGISISDLDARKIEAMQDALTRAGKASEGLARQFTVGIAPSIALIADSTQEQAEGFSMARAAGEALGSTMRGLTVIVANLGVESIRGVRNLVEFANRPAQIVQSFVKRAQAIPGAMELVGQSVATIVKNPIDSLRVGVGAFFKWMTQQLANLLEASREWVEKFAGNDGLAKIDQLQARIQGLGRTLNQKVVGEANQAADAFALVGERWRQIFAGSAIDQQEGLPILRDLDAKLAEAEAKVLAFMQRVSQPIQDPVTSQGQPAVGDTGAAAGVSNPWLNMLGSTESALSSAKAKIAEWHAFITKKAADQAAATAATEAAARRKMVEQTQMWAQSSMQIIEAFGGSSLESNKGWAIGQAAVNTGLAVTNALANIPAPANFAAATATAAMGLKNIQDIRSAHKGGGGAAGASFAGANTTGPVAEAGAGGGLQRNFEVHVSVQGGLADRRTAQVIKDAIMELEGDGG